MRKALLTVLGFSLMLSACASVHQEDLDAWVGQPVSELNSHPLIMTARRMVRTVTPDGTEIRNYINSRQVANCSGGGFGTGSSTDTLTSAQYSSFMNCMSGVAACNSVFYIRNGVVQHAAAIGTGGGRCYSSAASRPGFRGSVNIQ